MDFHGHTHTTKHITSTELSEVHIVIDRPLHIIDVIRFLPIY